MTDQLKKETSLALAEDMIYKRLLRNFEMLDQKASEWRQYFHEAEAPIVPNREAVHRYLRKVAKNLTEQAREDVIADHVLAKLPWL